MRTAAAGLLPIFRSELQANLLAVVLSPDAEPVSIAELARILRAPHPTVHREVERLERAGLVTTRRLGNIRLVEANKESPYTPELRSLVTRAFGVPAILRRELEAVEGIEAAAVFGSWADRATGGSGPVPRDIDLLVIGDADLDDVYAAVSRAEEVLRLPVDVVKMRRSEWKRQRRGFLESVESRPMVVLWGELP
ncbi:MAG: helix-turn-helix domain-containing protein [Actinobacteria bacterium]|jgi:DNA-binding transcriptional ArsR family regulator|nr:helix-turn-helix domain-containing protein [Actinomycetota bacterium]